MIEIKTTLLWGGLIKHCWNWVLIAPKLGHIVKQLENFSFKFFWQNI